jgi:NitT/TauT family transport system substrate-binding protein
MRKVGLILLSGVAFSAMAAAPHAEVKEVILGLQYGAVYLPAMVMENQKLVEKYLAVDGMSDVKVSWLQLGGAAAINDATLSGNLHFACQGMPSLAVIWDRTKGGIGVKALGTLANNNIWLNTRNPNIHSLKDFTEKDRIAIPSLQVSAQAIMMHIAVEQLWGKGNHAELDHIVVALPHPEAMAAVLNQGHEVNTHFATTPFHEVEMKAGLRTVTSAYKIMGGPVTGVNFTSTEKFRAGNPRVFLAVSKAFDESFDWINSDKRRAAKLYIEMTKEKKLTEDELTQSISGRDMEYTKVPTQFGKVVQFMYDTGLVKNKPGSWRDLFFQEAHGLPGS